MIYIGKFLHTVNQQKKKEVERRHGEFHLLIEAGSREAAIEKFRERIREAREKTDFFEGECRIYLVHLLEMSDLPRERAQMFDFQSIVGDPAMPLIQCHAPSDENDGCRILDWEHNRPGIDGRSPKPFLSFEG
ncbi:MAG: hypothetical protein WHT06_15730 [Desulfobacterales bacterium]